MEPKIMLAIIAIALGAVIFVANGKFQNGTPTAGGNYDELAKCLTGQGVKMYGSSLCPHCNNQKAMFGSGWKFVDYVECATTDGAAVCRSAGIRLFPTWVFGDGTRMEGEMSLDALAAKTGCKLG